MFQVHANHREELTEIKAGEIGAVIGLSNTKTGDTLFWMGLNKESCEGLFIASNFSKRMDNKIATYNC